MSNKPVSPWTPVEVEEKQNGFKVSVWDRDYTIENDVLFTSIVSRGNEILSAPMRIVGLENGEEIKWQEQASFIMHKDEQKVTLCASQESSTFIVNTALEMDYDGYCGMDIKIMPIGKTVAEVFGVTKIKPNEYSLDKLWIEIPLKKEYAKMFHYYPYEVIPEFEDPSKGFERSSVCMSRNIPCSMTMPFKPLIWIGDENQGLCWVADTDINWEPAEENKAIEIIDKPDEVILRLHLVDQTVKAWQPVKGMAKNYTYPPLSFKMGIQATPVKPFPQNPYKEKIMHIDCFKKILEEYDDFLSNPVVEGSDENGYDRMKRLGVTTLLIHEKWNKIQNYWDICEPTEKLARTIIKECHDRGIKVIPYFGYEVSSLNPKFSEYATSRMMLPNGVYRGGWYRKPNQRDYNICLSSQYAKDMVQGIKKLTEDYGFDGVYLDSTLYPRPCINADHGCGYVNAEGKRRPFYNVTAIREFMKELYEYFEPRGGMVNPHLSNCCNVPALSFAHLNWDGEHSQTYINREGVENVPLDYMRCEYSARNFGVPYEFLAYTFDNWSFNDSLSIALIHGILSRPNDIAQPLEKMSDIWKTVDRFDMDNAVWKPYWDNGIFADDSQVKISYYETESEGKKKYLVFIANPTDREANNVTFKLSDKPIKIFSTNAQAEVGESFNLEKRGSDVLLIEEI